MFRLCADWMCILFFRVVGAFLPERKLVSESHKRMLVSIWGGRGPATHAGVTRRGDQSRARARRKGAHPISTQCMVLLRPIRVERVAAQAPLIRVVPRPIVSLRRRFCEFRPSKRTIALRLSGNRLRRSAQAKISQGIWSTSSVDLFRERRRRHSEAATPVFALVAWSVWFVCGVYVAPPPPSIVGR